MSRGHQQERDAPWAHGWRSSDTFIISTMSLALFTDELLFAFMLPLLPTVLEQRIGLDPSLTQRYTSIFLTEGAIVSVVASPFIGSIADAVSSKKTLLLTVLILALISLACLSLTTHLIWLFVGRFFQCIVSQALWIVGMATMAENLGSEHMAKIAGLSSILTAAGTTAGPLLSGLLFGAGGYWCAWAGAGAFLLVDIIMRLLMLEKPVKSSGVQDGEREPLVKNNQPGANGEQPDHPPCVEVRGWRFHVCLFQDARFSAGIYCSFAYALLIGCLESTMAVHVRSAFGWSAVQVGLLLGLIQGPGILLAAPVGWMKDRVGSRIPTTVGFLMSVPFIVLLGAPGDDRFSFAAEARGKTIFVGCMAAIGCLLCLLNGIGSIEATETIDELEAREPGKFGSNGGYSRALALTSMTWMAGLMCGPLLAGFVMETFGYFELQCCLGVVSFTAGLVALLFLNSRRSHAVKQQQDE
ncbi:hypothetical protein N7494_009440 [Penicillium frequentans]|uniref:Major facilitator superfamily (MFS) profile domain-containing protein n=1 Tax=Penicillium frequentans TaxID=3151616 RepID=A0AAD6CSR2_9EURO|nr:hypothetical protein N7494_009440 [Penicillium glabrum]